jgi:hypothetical protein
MVALVSLALEPTVVRAWEPPAGSPPGWQTHWVQTTGPVAVFANATGDQTFGEAIEGLYFRVDAPEQHARLWVFDPLGGGWAWLPSDHTRRVAEPDSEQVQASAPPLDPKAYLYAKAPDLAPRLDCIIQGESGWDPSQQNPRSRAAGLAQFLPSTWATTPEGQSGRSPFEPLASIDAAIWLATNRGWGQWQVYVQGRCH